MSLQIYEKYLPWRPASGSPKNYICGEKIPVARALLVGIVVVLFSSCYDKGDCLITNSSLINIKFKKRTNSSIDTAIQFSSIEIMESNIVFDTIGTTNNVFLPVDPSKTEARFIFNYKDSSVDPDTVNFAYRNETVILNGECPALTYQKNVAISKSTYDSTQIRVLNNQLLKDLTNNAIVVNFQILY